jgi:SAM-dependent methyltransferase
MTTLSGSFDQSRDAWRMRPRVQKYGTLQGWIDDAERIAINSLADEVRGSPILDLGVGAGRTAWLLRLLTSDYVGVEWSQEMVEVYQAMYPSLDVRQGDARDLSQFPANKFKMVFFSYNGIDYNNHEDRQRVLTGIHRVLLPGGIFAYSTVSKNGSMYGKPPWHVSSGRSPRAQVRAAVSFVLKLPRRLSEYPRLYANWWTERKRAEDHGDWATSPVAHADFRLMHFTTVDAERRALAGSGFVPAEFLTSEGCPLAEDIGTTASDWFFVVARKA